MNIDFRKIEREAEEKAKEYFNKIMIENVGFLTAYVDISNKHSLVLAKFIEKGLFETEEEYLELSYLQNVKRDLEHLLCEAYVREHGYLKRINHNDLTSVWVKIKF